MPNIGPLEIAVVLIIVLIIFGPKRLPELGQSMGRGIREFKNSLTGDKDKDEPVARLRPVDFEDRLTLVEHLDELRTRIVISLVTLAVAFGLCFWQNSHLLDIAN